jgi:hypothetical protein
MEAISALASAALNFGVSALSSAVTLVASIFQGGPST